MSSGLCAGRIRANASATLSHSHKHIPGADRTPPTRLPESLAAFTPSHCFTPARRAAHGSWHSPTRLACACCCFSIRAPTPPSHTTPDRIVMIVRRRPKGMRALGINNRGSESTTMANKSHVVISRPGTPEGSNWRICEILGDRYSTQARRPLARQPEAAWASLCPPRPTSIARPAFALSR